MELLTAPKNPEGGVLSPRVTRDDSGTVKYFFSGVPLFVTYGG